MKSSALRVRVDPDLHDEFLDCCKEQDMSASHVLRQFMRAFVEKHGQRSQKEIFRDIDKIANIQK